jgi:hypothetical protein
MTEPLVWKPTDPAFILVLVSSASCPMAMWHRPRPARIKTNHKKAAKIKPVIDQRRILLALAIMKDLFKFIDIPSN